MKKTDYRVSTHQSFHQTVCGLGEKDTNLDIFGSFQTISFICKVGDLKTITWSPTFCSPGHQLGEKVFPDSLKWYRHPWGNNTIPSQADLAIVCILNISVRRSLSNDFHYSTVLCCRNTTQVNRNGANYYSCVSYCIMCCLTFILMDIYVF